MNTVHGPWRFLARTEREPSAQDLYFAPELASIHVLHEAVRVSLRTLDVAHAREPPPRNASANLAKAIFPLLGALDGLLAHYRSARSNEQPDIPNQDDDEEDEEEEPLF